MSYANNKGADQPAHPRSLISAFIVRCLDSIISLDSTAEISRLVSVSAQACLYLAWSETPEEMFCNVVAHLNSFDFELIIFVLPLTLKLKKNELWHDKTNKVSVRSAKTQISLGICWVWSVFAVCMKKPWVLSYPLSAQRRLWSDWADAQADMSLR